MLTIKGPIELKTNKTFTGHFEGFAERIEANYSVMGTKIEAEDLLHMVTSPPEIFIEEGGDVNVLNSSAVFEGQSQKIDIVNNLMNRIVVDADYGLTYQDRIFITNVLTKLGVTDVKSFMKRVSNLEFDTIETAKLTNDYFSELAQSVNRIENIALHSGEETRTLETEREERSKAFYTSIMDRLKTAAIYQIVRNFSDITMNNTISEGLVLNSEQNFLTKKVLLNSLREDLSGERLPLTYRSEEYIEEVNGPSEEITDIAVTRALSASVLLEMVKNLYHAVFDKSEYREGKVFDFSKNFYRLGDNILSRISYRFEGSRFYDYHDILESAKDEFESALTIFTSAETNNEEREEYLLSLQKTIENLYGTTENIRNINALNDQRIEENEALTQLTLQTAEETISDTERIEASTERETISTQELERELSEINERNIRARDRYTEIFSELKRRAKRDSLDGRTLTKQEAMKALSDRNYRPETFTEGRDIPIERDLMVEAVRDTLMEFPEGDINVYELMERYNERNEVPSDAVQKANAIQSLISDIRRVETVYREEADVEKEASKAGERAARKLVKSSYSGEGQRGAIFREEAENKKVDLIHKLENNLSEEEIRESLEEIRRSTKTEKKETESDTVSIISNEKKNEKRIEEVGADFMKQRQRTDAEIEAMISRGVKSQMSQISEQVIGKLAKKLQSDRSRRGL